jgi:hypothetical protein
MEPSKRQSADGQDDTMDGNSPPPSLPPSLAHTHPQHHIQLHRESLQLLRPKFHAIVLGHALPLVQADGLSPLEGDSAHDLQRTHTRMQHDSRHSRLVMPATAIARSDGPASLPTANPPSPLPPNTFTGTLNIEGGHPGGNCLPPTPCLPTPSDPPTTNPPFASRAPSPALPAPLPCSRA